MESGEEIEEREEGEFMILDDEFGDKMLLLLFCFRPFVRRLDEDDEEREVFETVKVVDVGKMVVVLISQSDPLFEPGGVGGRPGDINSEESRLEELKEEEEDVGELTLLFNKAASVKFLDVLFEFDSEFDEGWREDFRFPLIIKLLPICKLFSCIALDIGIDGKKPASMSISIK